MATLPSNLLQFSVGSVLFARSFVKGIYENYIQKPKKKIDEAVNEFKPLKGIGLDPQSDKLPKELPSIIEIKKSIPKHCFEPRVSTSMFYVVLDVFLVVATFAVIRWIHSFENPWLWWSSLILYWGIQGTFFTALFVIGHDCGHDSFSHHRWLNDLVGQLVHGFILAPYYMWKLTHRIHHKNNANIHKDEVYYPSTIERNSMPGFGFGLGWFVYIVTGYSPRTINHFNIMDRTFRGHLIGCLATLGIMGAMCGALYWWAQVAGWTAVLIYYVVPVFVFASYMVVITFLHHTEINIPWYADSEWDFVRGQLSTIDRDYGYVHYLIHSIGTHQMHHMFTKIPHYHLEEATTHFRKSFPHLVKLCDEPIIPSFFRMFRKYGSQSKIDEDTKVHYYK